LIPLYLKRLYNDDLSFKGAKVVYTVTSDKLSTPLDERFLIKLKADGVPVRDIKKFSSMTPDTDMLHRMAIDYSHAVVFRDPDVSPELIEYVKESGKPYLVIDNPDKEADAYAEFFKSL
ncbi:MAG: hypothetical protein K2J63_03755, partial [Muribaculaceae bacterium]|nr:hypothetical protein [Muribaculaceae bacterium]